MKLEATYLREDLYAVRPQGALGTCGWAPEPWTVQYVRARSAEEDFQAARAGRPAAEVPVAAAGSLAARPGDWPGYRGPDRDGVVRNAALRTDWKARPPREVWRQRVGPGWSSVAVVGDRLFTQEQRGEQEAVVCYDAASGREVWSHEDPARFWEAAAGVGPRATPTFADSRLYTMGAKGLLNALDAATGRRLWSHDLVAEYGAPVPQWGFSGSPLVVGTRVIVFAGGEGPGSLRAFQAASGELAWTASVGESSYASPQPVVLAGTPQVLMLTNRGLTSVAAESGEVLWEHPIPLPPAAPRSVQPLAVGETQVLLASEADVGTLLLDVTHDQAGWKAAPRWTSRALKPAFNDPVVKDGIVYGFDGRIFGCIDLQSGKARWKGDRYGHGQVLLVDGPPLLLVMAESGDVVLLRASADGPAELGRFRALGGKTWNHPVLAGGRLFVRNAEEMACYDVSTPPEGS